MVAGWGQVRCRGLNEVDDILSLVLAVMSVVISRAFCFFTVAVVHHRLDRIRSLQSTHYQCMHTLHKHNTALFSSNAFISDECVKTTKRGNVLPHLSQSE